MSWSGYRKQKDGPQQGTLFDLREVPSEPVDSPGMQKRGRRAEMLDAMPTTKVFSSDPRHDKVREKIESRGSVAARHPTNPWVAEGNVATDHAGKGRRAEIARDLADRTTVPSSDLSGLAQISEGQYSRGAGPEGPDLHPKFKGDHGTHYAPNRHANGPVIESSGKMPLNTVVHEVGHHVSRGSPGYDDRKSPRVDDPRGSTVGPREEAFADDYAATHADPSYEGYGGSFLADDPVYNEARSVRPSSNVGQQFQQLEAFETETAIAPDADAEVQAYTRDEGRDVIGWGPYPQHDPQSIYKHEYDPEHEKPFYGANYVSMFDDDVVPERHRDDAYRKDTRPRQTWKSR